MSKIKITGKQVERVRLRLQLDVGSFAIALGVNQSSVYRWEAAGGNARPRPGQVKILAELIKCDDETLVAVGNRIKSAIAAKQPLAASSALYSIAGIAPG